MWNDEQKLRFQELRTRERQQELTDVEKAELARMIGELEEEEAAYLRPATQRLEQRNIQMAAENVSPENTCRERKAAQPLSAKGSQKSG